MPLMHTYGMNHKAGHPALWLCDLNSNPQETFLVNYKSLKDTCWQKYSEGTLYYYNSKGAMTVVSIAVYLIFDL